MCAQTNLTEVKEEDGQFPGHNGTDLSQITARLAISDDSSTAEINDTAKAPAFPQFSALPQEIKDAIWHAAVSSIPPRIFEATVLTGVDGTAAGGDEGNQWAYLIFEASQLHPAPLNLLHASPDSRRVVNESGWVPAFPEPEGSRRPGRCVWFRPLTDLLYVRIDDLRLLAGNDRAPPNPPKLFPYRAGRGWDIVRNLAVYWWIFSGLEADWLYSRWELEDDNRYYALAGLQAVVREEWCANDKDRPGRSNLLEAVEAVYASFPATRTIYICVSPNIVSDDRSSYHHDPLEDREYFDSLPLYAVKLRDDDVIHPPFRFEHPDPAWGEVRGVIEAGLASEWAQEFVLERFADKEAVAGGGWPPAVVGLMVARGGDVLEEIEASGRLSWKDGRQVFSAWE
ncbi:hypothetical protein ACRE_024970 [Hapsidospora chrysogenum ATCC 11550]|uniref:2EXR domain-containing protein n=1 Tax=Hapsidospora chrysogenum (strain ATCC 11550 / CBS 779.69 / DSM 880 / IAM 14645 / JCM 23072 / IMI 49137) TaxID=857340 RepID=A0A086TB72_HAPC1|nr:hypothetical protein ACRE_024970 [Hapsidospora chrysogenum ATCC 11550]